MSDSNAARNFDDHSGGRGFERRAARRKGGLRPALMVADFGARAGLIEDVSETGIRVGGIDPEAIRNSSTCRFDLPQRFKKHTRIESKCEIAWIDNSGHAGLRLVELPPVARQNLREWVNTEDSWTFQTERTASPSPAARVPSLVSQENSLPVEPGQQESVAQEEFQDFGSLINAMAASTLGTLNQKAVPQAHSRVRSTPEGQTTPPMTPMEDVALLKKEILDKNIGLSHALNAAIERMLLLTGAQGAAVALQDGDSVNCMASMGVAPKPGARFLIDNGLLGECYQTGRIVRCDDAFNDPRVEPQVWQQRQLRSILLVPIHGDSSTVGIVEVLAAKPRAFDYFHVLTCRLVAEMISELLTRSAMMKSAAADLGKAALVTATARAPLAAPLGAAHEEISYSALREVLLHPSNSVGAGAVDGEEPQAVPETVAASAAILAESHYAPAVLDSLAASTEEEAPATFSAEAAEDLAEVKTEQPEPPAEVAQFNSLQAAVPLPNPFIGARAATHAEIHAALGANFPTDILANEVSDAFPVADPLPTTEGPRRELSPLTRRLLAPVRPHAVQWRPQRATRQEYAGLSVAAIALVAISLIAWQVRQQPAPNSSSQRASITVAPSLPLPGKSGSDAAAAPTAVALPGAALVQMGAQKILGQVNGANEQDQAAAGMNPATPEDAPLRLPRTSNRIPAGAREPVLVASVPRAPNVPNVSSQVAQPRSEELAKPAPVNSGVDPSEDADTGSVSGPRAQVNMGNKYRDGISVERNYAEAAKWYRAAAEQGDTVGQNHLADMYREGKGVPQNTMEAVKWYQMATVGGSASAQTSLGDMYRDGRGVPRDYAAAMKYYRMAANQGNVGAQDNLGDLLRDGKGAPQNYGEAVRWYFVAANSGFPTAQLHLGDLYRSGLGVPQDFAKAAKWYREAAAKGVAAAQANLGDLYRDGAGVPQDSDQALKWYQMAADQGVIRAQVEMTKLSGGGRPSTSYPR